jgi:hypothetical protein
MRAAVRTRVLLSILPLTLLLCACQTRGDLRPAVPPGQQQDAGVRLALIMDAWYGDPPNLADAIVPVHVTIENQSPRSLRIRYSELTFVGPIFDYAPLPPYRLAGRTMTVKSPDPMLVPRFSSSGFRVAPQNYPNYPGREVWSGAWKDWPLFYELQYPKWTGALPTVDMIELALPEGVLEPGGRVSGFLYFETLHREAEDPVFEFDLVDARSFLTFGVIRIPFMQR